MFVRMGQYSDAMTSYEHVMSEKPSVKAGQCRHITVSLCVYGVVIMYVCFIRVFIEDCCKGGSVR